MSRLTEMHAMINRVMNHVDSNTMLLRRSQQFTAMVLQLFVVVTDLKHFQPELLSPQILTPRQLSKKIAIITGHIS